MKKRFSQPRLAVFAALIILSGMMTIAPFRRVEAAKKTGATIQKGENVTNTAFSVTNLNDSGPGSLRQAIIEANADPNTPHTITFGVTGTITLTSALPVITRSMTISGPGVNQITISGNQTFQLFIIDLEATLDISNVTVRAGFAPNAAFGGAFQAAGALNVDTCVISDNTSPVIAGSAIGGVGGPITIRNSLFTGNRGVLLIHGGTLTVENTTFSGNTVFSLYFFPDLAPVSVTFRNATMANVSGSGVFFDGRFQAMTFTTQNSIYQNGGTNFQSTSTPPTFTTLGGNINDDNSFATSLTGTNDLVNTNALLSALGNYGGPTQTVAILPGSPAIDNSVAVGAPANDARGIARPQLSGIDSGAFESRGFSLNIAGGNNQSAPVGSAFPTSPSVGVSPLAAGEPVDGGRVTFTAPSSGASCSFQSNPAPISGGLASPGLTPANTITGGPYTVSAAARGGNSVNFSLTNICRTISLTPSGGSLAGGTVGQNYNQSVSASGGLTPYGYVVTGGTLPNGLNLSPTGTISGIPTASGTFNFTVTATDSSACGQSGNYAITIAPNLAAVNVNSSVSLVVTGQSLTPATCPSDVNNIVLTATLTNIGSVPLNNPYFEVIELQKSGAIPPPSPFHLLSANGATCGSGGLIGSQQSVGSPGFILQPGQSVPVTFTIGLSELSRFRFFVNVFAFLNQPNRTVGTSRLSTTAARPIGMSVEIRSDDADRSKKVFPISRRAESGAVSNSVR
jgi:hypothetical protein